MKYAMFFFSLLISCNLLAENTIEQKKDDDSVVIFELSEEALKNILSRETIEDLLALQSNCKVTESVNKKMKIVDMVCSFWVIPFVYYNSFKNYHLTKAMSFKEQVVFDCKYFFSIKNMLLIGSMALSSVVISHVIKKILIAYECNKRRVVTLPRED